MYRALLNALTKHTIDATEIFTRDGVRMVATYVAPAHSSADIAVYLPEHKIVLAGDIITANTCPNPVIHYETGGTSSGWITSTKALLGRDADTYMPGHGPIEGKAALQARLRDVEQRRSRIKAMIEDKWRCWDYRPAPAVARPRPLSWPPRHCCIHCAGSAGSRTGRASGRNNVNACPYRRESFMIVESNGAAVHLLITLPDLEAARLVPMASGNAQYGADLTRQIQVHAAGKSCAGGAQRHAKLPTRPR